jgi:hypothetical protein
MKRNPAMNKTIGLCLSTLLLVACGSSSPAGTAKDSAAGGDPGSMDATAAGGKNGTGGTNGTGGATATGGKNGTGGAAATGGTMATGGTIAWRPFSNDSPWNTPIGANPTLDPNSKALIADWENSSPYGEHLDVNIKDFSIPLFYADATTPTYTVRADVGGYGWSGSNGQNTTGTMPIPGNAAPDHESDHHLLVIDKQQMQEWGCWNMVRETAGWHAGLCATVDLKGTGVRPIAEGNPTWYTSHGARACGFPLVAGLIRVEEIQAGRIDHALVVAYPHIRAGFYTPPASTAQAANGNGAQKDRGIPCGGRIQYDPSINLDTLKLTRTGRIIMQALQEYGAYVGDFSGAMSLYADGSPDAQAYWDSDVLDSYELLDKIDLADFRVIKLGTLYDNGNG